MSKPKIKSKPKQAKSKKPVKAANAKCCNCSVKNAAPGRKGKCWTCYNLEVKARDPFRYFFNRHVNNAKARGIGWEITFEEFKDWAVEVELLLGKGRTATGWHIDRIEDYDEQGNKIPYRVGNIQKLTNSENIAKENRRRKIARQKIIKYDVCKGGLTTAIVKPYEHDDTVPF